MNGHSRSLVGSWIGVSATTARLRKKSASQLRFEALSWLWSHVTWRRVERWSWTVGAWQVVNKKNLWEPQVDGFSFPLTNRLFWVPFFDPQLYDALDGQPQIVLGG